MKHRPNRHALALTTAAGAAMVLALTGVAAVPAQADDQPVITLQQTAPVAVSPATLAGVSKTALPYLSFTTTAKSLNTSATLTIDVTQLSAIADVTFSGNCTVVQHVASCGESFYYDDLTGVGTISAETQITVKAKAGAPAGSSAGYTITGSADNAAIVGGQGTVEIGGPAYDLTQPTNLTGLAVGSAVNEPVRFTNIGDRAADGTQVLLWASPGIGFAQRYANCEYSTDGGPMVEEMALCTIPGQVLPGERAALAPAVRLNVESTAYSTYLDSMIAPAGDPGIEQSASGHQWTQGAGGQLTLKVLTPGTANGAPSGVVSLPERGTHGNYRITSLQAANTADFSVTGASATAAQGDTVTLDFTMTNNGPATVFYRSGDIVGPVDVQLPPGTSPVGSSANCRQQGGGYYCSNQSIVSTAGSVTHFSLTVRVDQVIPGAQGSVAMDWSPAGQPAFDTNPSDDTATLTVN
ncbi:hypothetical protein V2S66_15335 [Streptomyces sp. V4-01]|uniref:DUF11 domain-containing protein n=1 Tax=Actinacidiphila polyblastidii TaxID=3110430 RepID=A0ABU7PC10_9ACTN|nr:hypothetical protein [Streptomyces sp. V4-01]